MCYIDVHVSLSFRFAFIYLILFCFMEKKYFFSAKITSVRLLLMILGFCWLPASCLSNLTKCRSVFFVIWWALRAYALLIMLCSCERATFETAFGTTYSKISYFFKLLCNWMPLTIASKTMIWKDFFAILYSLLIESRWKDGSIGILPHVQWSIFR